MKTSLLTPSDLPLEDFREFGGSRNRRAPEDDSKSAEAVPDLVKVQKGDEDQPWLSHWTKSKEQWELLTDMAKASGRRAMKLRQATALTGITVHPSIFPSS